MPDALTAALAAIPAYAAAHQLEALGAVLGLTCVWLLMRENTWTWPLGALYAVTSLQVFWQDALYGQFALHLYFLAVNLYGWYHWVVDRPDDAERLPVTRTAPRQLGLVLGAAAVLIVLLAVAFDTWTDARFAWLDMGVTVLSVAAMWLSARKKLESWVFWLVIDIAYVAMFVATGNWFYLVLYALYVPMAVQGFRLWQRHLDDADTPAGALAT